MQIILIVLVVCGTFGLCYLVDKGFTNIFRGKPEHASGLSVRLSKKYGSIGLIMAVVGISAVFIGLRDTKLLIAGGGVLILIGICLIVYYMTFGVFYNENSFVLTTFGKKSQSYNYNQIKCQQLYVSYGTVVIELQLKDGRAVQLQSSMKGVYEFMDTAFAGWLKQTGRRKEDCSFYDPDNSCWFPGVEE